MDETAHIIQMSTAPVFLLMGIGTLINVLSGRLARIMDRGRVLEEHSKNCKTPRAVAIINQERRLEKRAMLIFHAIKLSTASALLVCFVIATLFASLTLRYSPRLIVSVLFIAAMLASILSLTLFLREVSLAIESFELALPSMSRQSVNVPGPATRK